MSMVIAEVSMSLDGFIATVHDAVQPLMGWYANGDTLLTMADGKVFHVRR